MDNTESGLLWGEQLIARLDGIQPHDFPWMTAKFELVEVDPKLLDFLHWVERESKSEDGIVEEPPFPSRMLEGWFLKEPGKSKTEISFPIFDFTNGTVEWR